MTKHGGWRILARMPSTDFLYHETLPNGLDVYILSDPGSSLVSAKTYVRTGSMDEAPFLGSGLSHFLEHLVASGPSTFRTEDDYKTLIAKLGGSYNAYTTTNHTCYYLNSVPDHVSDMLTILYEWMFFTAFTALEFERERGVITREIERDAVHLGSRFHRAQQEGFYAVHPARYPVLGYLENFKKVTAEQLHAYYKARYTPANVTLVLGGPIAPEAWMPQIRETFGKIPRVATVPPVYVEEPVFSSPRCQQLSADTAVTYWGIRFPGVSLMSPDIYPLDLLDFVLGNGESALLNRLLVEEKKLAYSIGCTSFTPACGGGYFEIYAQTETRHVAALEREVRRILEDLQSKPVSPKKLAMSKKQKIAQDLLSVDTIEDKIERIGQGVIYANDPDYFDYYRNQFKQVSAADLQRAAQTYFDFSKGLTVVMSPKSDVPKSRPGTVIGTLPPRLPTLHRLSNGVRVVLYPDSSKAAVLVKSYLSGGIRAETAAQNGLGYLMAQSWGRSSAQYSKSIVRDRIEGNGAELSATMGNNTFSYSLECLSSDFKRLWPIYVDALRHPVFVDADVAEEKRKQLKRISQRRDEWSGLCTYHFRKTFFGEHPYGLSLIGEPKSVTPLTGAAVAAHYHQVLDPAHWVICIMGDFEPTAILAQCEQHFVSVQATPRAWPQDFSEVRHRMPQRFQFEIPQDVAALFIGFDGPVFSDTVRRRKLELLSAILTGGNGPSGRIFNGLRDQGLVYQASSTVLGGLDYGLFNLYALTSSPQLAQAEQFMLDELASLQSTLVSPEECQLAIAELRYSAKERISTWDGLATVCATDELYGVGFDAFTREEADLQKLGPKDIQRLAQELLVHPQIYSFERAPS